MQSTVTLSPDRAVLRRRTLGVSLAVCCGLPFLHAFVLQLIYAYFIEGNVAFAAIESAAALLITFLQIVSLFAGYAVLIYATFLFGLRASRVFFFHGVLQLGVTALSSLGVTYFITTPRLFLLNLGHLLWYLFLNFLLTLLPLILIRVVTALLFCRLGEKAQDVALRGQLFSPSHPLLLSGGLASLIYIASALVLAVTETVQDLWNYGPPVNKTEWIHLISPYVTCIAYFFIGYVVIVSVFYLLQAMHLKIRHSRSEDSSQG